MTISYIWKILPGPSFFPSFPVLPRPHLWHMHIFLWFFPVPSASVTFSNISIPIPVSTILWCCPSLTGMVNLFFRFSLVYLHTINITLKLIPVVLAHIRFSTLIKICIWVVSAGFWGVSWVHPFIQALYSAQWTITLTILCMPLKLPSWWRRNLSNKLTR